MNDSYMRQSALPRDWRQNTVEVLVSVGGVTGLVVTTSVGRAVLQHGGSLNANLRVLMLNLLACTALVCGTSVAAIANDLYSSTYHRYDADQPDAATRRFQSGVCKRLALLDMLGVLGNQLALLFLALERLYATRNYKTYETVKYAVIPALLCFLQWLMIVLLVIDPPPVGHPSDSDVSNMTQHCTAKLFETVHSMVQETGWATHIFVNLSLDAATAVAFMVIWTSNKAKRRQDDSFETLAQRFQIKQNINTSLALSQLAFFKAAWNLVARLWFFLALSGQNTRDADSLLHFAFLMKVMNFWQVIEGIIQSVSIVSSSRPIVEAIQWYPKRYAGRNHVASKQQLANDVQQAHFEYLDRAWKQQTKPSSSDRKREIAQLPTPVPMIAKPTSYSFANVADLEIVSIADSSIEGPTHILDEAETRF